MTDYDVIIIGAGISGSAIARELSKTKAKICLIEKENDVACGSSKANSGIIHAGYDPLPGTLMAKLNVRGTSLYRELSEKLNFEYKNTGSLVVAFDEKGLETVKTLYARGLKNEVSEMKILNQKELKEIEPDINPDALGALYAKTAGIVNPYQATWAFAESAVINGVDFLRNAKVHSVTKREDGTFEIKAGNKILTSKYVVNAAGTHADEISRLAGARDFSIKQRRGEYMLFDSETGSLSRHVIFQTPTALGKGVLVTQTVDGNLLVGPSADDQNGNSLDYTGTTRKSQDEIFSKALLSIPSIPRSELINSFAGIRAIAEENGSPVNDFIIEEDSKVKGFINVAGICSPGLSAAPAIAEYTALLLSKAGLEVKFNPDGSVLKRSSFVETRKGIKCFKTASLEEKHLLIKENPQYGQVICRCETITEGEIVSAIKSPLGALDLDGVKRRTRAGMGRCQGGFCLPRVTEIIARETGIPLISVTKFGGSSFVLDSRK